MPRRGVGSKAISAPEGTQLSSRCDGRVLLAPTGASVLSLTENSMAFSGLHQRKVNITIHRKELILVCYSRT